MFILFLSLYLHANCMTCVWMVFVYPEMYKIINKLYYYYIIIFMCWHIFEWCLPTLGVLNKWIISNISISSISIFAITINICVFVMFECIPAISDMRVQLRVAKSFRKIFSGFLKVHVFGTIFSFKLILRFKTKSNSIKTL